MSNSIKFHHADSGTLRLNNGSTSLSDLFSIGAITLTTKHNSKTSQLGYATDKEGLEKISEKAEYAAHFLNNSTHALGVLLAHVEHSEVESEMPSIAWLIAGLGELAGMVTEAKAEIDYSIKTVDEANFESKETGNE